MRTLSLAAGVLPEFTGGEVAEAAVRAGYTHAGFTVDDAWSDATTKQVRRFVDTGELSVLDVEVVWIPDGGGITDLHKKIVDVGLELGAANLLMVSAESEAAIVADAMHTLCDRSAKRMRIAIEFLRITAIQTFTQARQIAELCNHPAAAVLVDTLHLQRSGEAPEVYADAHHLISYAQFCDGNRLCAEDYESLLEDAIDLRGAAGEGELDLPRMLGSLPSVPLSLEVRSRALRVRYPDAMQRAQAVRLQTEEYLQSL